MRIALALSARAICCIVPLVPPPFDRVGGMGLDEMRRTKIGDSYFIRIGLSASTKSRSEEVDSWLRPILFDCQRNMHYDIAILLKAVVARGVRLLIKNGSYAV